MMCCCITSRRLDRGWLYPAGVNTPLQVRVWLEGKLRAMCEALGVRIGTQLESMLAGVLLGSVRVCTLRRVQACVWMYVCVRTHHTTPTMHAHTHTRAHTTHTHAHARAPTQISTAVRRRALHVRRGTSSRTLQRRTLCLWRMS